MREAARRGQRSERRRDRPRGRRVEPVRVAEGPRAARGPAAPRARPRRRPNGRHRGDRRRPRQRGRRRSRTGSTGSSEHRVRNPDPRHLSGSLQIGLAAALELEPPAEGSRRRPRRPAADAARGDPGARSRPAGRASDRSSSRTTPTAAAPTRAAARRTASAWSTRRAATAVSGRSSPRIRTSSSRSRSAARTPTSIRRLDLAELAWAERVRANREQVDRVREVPDGADFYAPVSGLFRVDPDRRGRPGARRPARAGKRAPGETWLDIGAGAGRFALPLARVVREVIAIEPSAGCSTPSRDDMATHGIDEHPSGRGPLADGRPARPADVALIAHVGYDIEAIGPFVRRDGGVGAAALRRGPDGAPAGIAGRPVLADRPRRGAGPAAGAARVPRAARGGRPLADGHD